MTSNKSRAIYEQAIPLFLTVAVFIGLSLLVWLTVKVLNFLPTGDKILPILRWSDVIIGATIYLKTSVDFAIFMGRLMSGNPGWKNRIAIEAGTALGNALGTIFILVIWIFFKQIHWLLAIMIFLAALVLFEMAYGGLEHFVEWEGQGGVKRGIYISIERCLSGILKLTRPVTSKILPDLGKQLRADSRLNRINLFWFALTVPFILGLDDFAGYVPLFNIVNVFGFSVGALGAHAVLNIALFTNPQKTTAFVRNAWVSFFGTVAFIILAVWGLVEVAKIVFRL